MILKTPKQIPPFHDLLADLGASADDAAKALGVSVSTLYRWRNRGAPRSAALALYWISSWGLFEVCEDAAHRATMAERLAECRQREIVRLRQEVERLKAIGDFGSANDPVVSVRGAVCLDGAKAGRRPVVIEHAGIVQATAVPLVWSV